MESGMPITREKLRESAVAMRRFFDRELPLSLLYRSELSQYEKIIETTNREYLARTIARKG